MYSDKLPNPAMSPDLPAPVPEATCRFCALLCQTLELEAAGSHPESTHFFTEREMRLLNRMIEARNEIRKLRKRMTQIEEDLATQSLVRDEGGKKWQEIRGKLWTQAMAEDTLFISERLTQLSHDWERMDQERIETAEERMRLLGCPV